MAGELKKYVGRSVALEFFIGYGDTLPGPSDWLPIGSLRTKEFNVEWDMADATDADAIGSLRESLATFKSLTISGDGVSRREDDTVGNQTALYRHFINPTTTGDQPVVWLRMTFPDLTFTAYMMLSSMSRSAPYDDVVTFSFEASSTSSEFGLVVEDTP